MTQARLGACDAAGTPAGAPVRCGPAVFRRGHTVAAVTPPQRSRCAGGLRAPQAAPGGPGVGGGVNPRGVDGRPGGVLLDPGVREQSAQTGLGGLDGQPQQVGADLVVGGVLGGGGRWSRRCINCRRRTRRAGPSTCIQALGYGRGRPRRRAARGRRRGRVAPAPAGEGAGARGRRASLGPGCRRSQFHHALSLASGGFSAPAGPLAQLAEQRTFNPRVVGSIPTGPTVNAQVSAEHRVSRPRPSAARSAVSPHERESPPRRGGRRRRSGRHRTSPSTRPGSSPPRRVRGAAGPP